MNQATFNGWGTARNELTPTETYPSTKTPPLRSGNRHIWEANIRGLAVEAHVYDYIKYDVMPDYEATLQNRQTLLIKHWQSDQEAWALIWMPLNRYATEGGHHGNCV